MTKTEVTLQSTSRMIAKFASALNAVRSYADRLYSAISAGYNVDCHPEHETRLFLQSRSALMEKKTTVAFTMAFSPSNTGQNPIPCYQTDIKVLEEMESCYATYAIPDPNSHYVSSPNMVFNRQVLKPEDISRWPSVYRQKRPIPLLMT